MATRTATRRESGDPRWLASGLQKLEHYKQGIVNQAAEAHPASAHMFIVNPLSGLRVDALFSTHPPTEERVARLSTLLTEAIEVFELRLGAPGAE